MTELESMVQLEKELNPLMDRNQHRYVKDDYGRKCVDAMIRYINAINSMSQRDEYLSSGMDIFFLKRFTKTARNVLKTDDRLDAYLDSLYALNRAGEGRDLSKHSMPEANKIKIAAHFLADAGDVSRKRFELLALDHRNQKIAAGTNWYEDAHRAASSLHDVDIDEAAVFYSFSGDAAREMFKMTRDVHWGERAFDDYMVSANWNHHTRRKDAMHTYGHASMIAREMLKGAQTDPEKIKWAERVYSSNSLAADIAIEPRHQITAKGHAADGARVRFELTRDRDWGVDALGYYKDVLAHYRDNADRPGWLNKIERYVSQLQTQLAAIGGNGAK